MRLDQLTEAINEISTTLDDAELAHGKAQDQLLRKAAIRACRAYEEAMADLDADLATVREYARDAVGQTRARELRADRDGFARLVRTQILMLQRLGVREEVVERLKVQMGKVQPRSLDGFTNTVRELRDAVCALKEENQDEAERERARERLKDRLWLAVEGLGGLACFAAAVPLVFFAPPVAGAAVTAGFGFVFMVRNRFRR